MLPEMKSLITKFVDKDSDRFTDQTFLRMVIWPRIRDATLCIDSYYKIGHTDDYPDYAPKIGSMTVGHSWHESQILISK